MGSKMIDQILNTVLHGTSEEKHVICNETEIILECKLCRDLFRTFPRFLAHRETYCSQTSPNKDVAVPVALIQASDKTDLYPEHSFAADESSQLEINLQMNVSKPLKEEELSPYSNHLELPDESISQPYQPMLNMEVQDKQQLDERVMLQNNEQILNNNDSNALQGYETEPIFEQQENLKSEQSGQSTRGLDLDQNSETMVLFELADYTTLQCRKCVRKFSQRGSLRRHILEVHGKKHGYYSCPFCTSKVWFRYFRTLVTHLKNLHRFQKEHISRIHHKLQEISWIEFQSDQTGCSSS